MAQTQFSAITGRNKQAGRSHLWIIQQCTHSATQLDQVTGRFSRPVGRDSYSRPRVGGNVRQHADGSPRPHEGLKTMIVEPSQTAAVDCDHVLPVS
jgi:hypothetical protein